MASAFFACLIDGEKYKLKMKNEDENAGLKIVRRAIESPIRQIAENAGVEGSIVVSKVLGSTKPKCTSKIHVDLLLPPPLVSCEKVS